MKYTIIAFISCITSFTLANVSDGKTNSNGNHNDSLAFELLKLEYSFFATKNEDDRYQLLMQKVKLNLENASPKLALQDLQRIEKLNPKVLSNHSFYSHIQEILFGYALYNSCIEYLNKDTLHGFEKNKSFLKAICMNEETQIEELKNELRKMAFYLNKDTTLVFQQLKNYDIESTENKSVLLQFLLPGAGMINEGEIKEGITSFLINGIFVAAPILLFKQKLYFTALSYGIFPFSKFYIGGIKHTKFLADENLEIKINKIKRENAQFIYYFYKD